ncbi:MAG: alpha-xylosidase, partial [Clostridiales bacterium]|nr:alpha-xylosidase [Clostridiales bacterium]
MRFTDGYWQIRPEYTMTYAAQLARAERRGAELHLMAASRPIAHRGDTLNAGTINVRLFAPMEGVVGVEVVHFKGAAEREPRFELNRLPVEPAIAEDDGAWSFASGPLAARAQKTGPWRLDFAADGRVLTSSGFRGMGRALDRRDGASYMSDSLTLGVGECVYGLGERFAAYVKNGQQVDIWNADGGTISEQAYKSVPFYMTNRGYGVFVDDPSDVSFEVASEKVERVQFSTSGERLRYFVIYGPTPKQVLDRYTALTGRPALPPAWSFGLWLSTSFTTNYDEATTSSFIQGMADRDIPMSVFHFDCFWMKAFRWCDFEWDGAVFSDPEGMLRRYRERGLKLCVWMNPYVGQDSPLFDEGLAGGYFIKKENGDPWQTDLWQAGMAIVDVTNPAARDWYCGYLRRLLDMGVDCFKTDFGERIPVRGVKYHDGSDPLRMHNYYTHLYNRMVFELLEQHRGVGEAVLFARSATAGGQQYPVHWGGDNSATYPSMAETLRGGLSLAHSGFGFWSHDISGFEQTAPADVYKRWVAFGLLSSHSRLHGSSSYR